jgi:uncharacterized protein
VSFDLCGDARVDINGNTRSAIVLANLRRLRENEIDFGAIAVLARDTLSGIKDVYNFFDELNITHRVLAYYKTASSEQAQRHGLDFDELVGAYKALFHEWLASERATPVEPIALYAKYAARHVAGHRDSRFDRSKDEWAFIVNVNGDVCTDDGGYESPYGNIFRSPLSEIVRSDARAGALALAQDRMRRFCSDCPYFGSCPGTFVANATAVDRPILEANGCVVRVMLDYMINVFERTGICDFILQDKDRHLGDFANANSALTVA